MERIGGIIIFHLSKLQRAKFFILCDAKFLVRLQGKLKEAAAAIADTVNIRVGREHVEYALITEAV